MISLVQVMISVGYIFPLLLVFVLPRFENLTPFTNEPDFSDCYSLGHIAWRELLAFPAIVTITQLLLLLFVFRREDPLYEEYIYHRHHSSSNPTEERSSGFAINTDIQQSTEIPLSRLERDTWKGLMTVDGRRKVFSGGLVRFLQQFTGLNIVLNVSFYFRLHPDNIFVNLRLVITLSSIIGAIASMYLLKHYKRKLILLIGQLSS